MVRLAVFSCNKNIYWEDNGHMRDGHITIDSDSLEPESLRFIISVSYEKDSNPFISLYRVIVIAIIHCDVNLT